MSTPVTASEGNVRFCAVARKDGDKFVQIGSFAFNRTKSTKYEHICEKVLSKSDFQNRDRQIGQKEDFKMMIRNDKVNDIWYIVFLSSDYLNRVAYRIFEELSNLFQSAGTSRVRTVGAKGLNKDIALSGSIMELLQKFEEPSKSGMDRIAKIEAQIKHATSNTNEAIDAVLANSEKLENVLEKSEELRDNSMSYKEDATSLRKAMFLRNAKYTVILIVIVIALLVVLLKFVGVF